MKVVKEVQVGMAIFIKDSTMLCQRRVKYMENGVKLTVPKMIGLNESWTTAAVGTKRSILSMTMMVTCRATKKDGNQCTAKASTGCEFCKRHNPK